MKTVSFQKHKPNAIACLLVLLVLLLPFSSSSQALVINEIMASNSQTITDEDGDYEDWIELYNFSETPIALEGYGLSDDLSDPFRWIFPDVTIQPGQFLLVWASGKDRTNPANALHTNFSIESIGEHVLLSTPSGLVIDEIQPISIPTDISYGRFPDGTGARYFFSEPTPGASNNTQPFAEVLEPPVFSHPAGFYSSAFELSITHADPEVTIIYTLDGSEPCTSNLAGSFFTYKNQYPEKPGDDFGELLSGSYQSLVYTEPFEITDRSEHNDSITNISTTWHCEPYYFPNQPVFKGTVVRAIAMKNGALNSEVNTASFFVTDEGRDRFSLPVLSISTCRPNLFDYENGIYVAGVDYDNWRLQNPDASHNWQTEANFHRRGMEAEKPVSFEFFEADMPYVSISQRVGVRIHGGEARRRPMKSMRFYARNQYGAEFLNHSFFTNLSDESFKRLLLRNSGQDFLFTLMRDASIHQVFSHLKFDTQAYEPVIVFINGEYWGLQNLRERYDKYYFCRVYGVNPENIDYLTNNIEINEGDEIHYLQTLSHIELNGLAEKENYEYIQTRIDIENFRDYQIANIFAANTDWPGNNLDFWRLRTNEYQPNAPYGHDGRWRWMLYDMDFAFGLWEGSDAAMHNTLAFATEPGNTNWPNPYWSTFLLRSFLENSEFRTGFINRFADLLNTSFLPDHINYNITKIKNRIHSEMHEHILRWRTPYGMTAWQNHVNVMIDFATERPGYQRQHIIDHFELDGEYELEVNVSNKWHGHIRVNTIDIKEETAGICNNPYPWTGIYFAGVPVELEAVPAPGFAFSHWEGLPDGTSANLVFDPAEDISVKAHFVWAQQPELLYFWLFDDNLPNNTPLEQINATYEVPGNGLIQFYSSLEGYPFHPEHPNWRKASMERRNEPTEINYRPGGNNNIPFNDTGMRGLQVKQPFTGNAGENLMIFNLPTIGFKDPVFAFAAKDEGAADYLLIDYSVAAGNNVWISDGITGMHPLSGDYQLYEIDFTGIASVNDNPDFKIRICFGGSDMTADDGNRVTFNNFSLEGTSLTPPNFPPEIVNPVEFRELIEDGQEFVVDLNQVFSDPEGDVLIFDAHTDNIQMAELSITDNMLRVNPLQRGGAEITISADDGHNTPVTTSFRVLIYPKAYRFGEANFSFTEWDPNEPEYSYPEHMIFLQSDVSDPGIDHPLLYPYFVPHNDYHADDQGTIGFPYNNTGRTRINGLGEEGISFINTGRGRDLGGALLAIDTRGVTSARLGWTAGTILQNLRVYAIRLQYRADITEAFSDLIINDEPIQYLTATDGDVVEFESFELPAEILEKEYVQLLWRYYHVSGDIGPRAKLRLDEIIFSEVIGVPSVEDEPANIYSFGNSIFIEMPDNNESILHVYDLAGRLIQTQSLSGQRKHIVQLNSQKGIYIVRLITDKKVYSRKVLIY